MVSLSDLEELFADYIFILALLGVSAAALIFVVQLFAPITKVYASFSEGYSMCSANTYGYDYTALGDGYCAYSPGDVVITYARWPPDVNSVACAVTQYGIVCHRVYSYDPHTDKACFIGDNPRAKWTYCFTRKEYVGEAIGKLPRAFGTPGMALVSFPHYIIDLISAINSGKYPSL